MKKFLLFVLCVFAGIFLLGIVLSIVSIFFTFSESNEQEAKNKDITLFEYTGDCVSDKYLEITKVLDSGYALAKEKELLHDEVYLPTGLKVVLYDEIKGVAFYDGQLIKILPGECAKQVGVYKYDFNKTAPIVSIQPK